MLFEGCINYFQIISQAEFDITSSRSAIRFPVALKELILPLVMVSLDVLQRTLYPTPLFFIAWKIAGEYFP